jgi:hypothetical protein
MANQTVGSWLCDLDDVESRQTSTEAVLTWLDRAAERSRGRLSVDVEGDRPKGWLRWLAGRKRHVSPFFSIEWIGDYASLIFYDESWSEYRVLDAAHPVQPSEEMRLQISHGEPSAPPAAECMLKERAFRAMRERIESGLKPTWLSYKYVP